MPRLTDLGALKIVNPSEWKKKIKDAMKASGGRITDAAASLDVSWRQLYRWLDEPDFSDVKRVANGEPRNGRRGQKADAEIKPRKKRKAA